MGKPSKVNEMKQAAKGNVLKDFKDAAQEHMSKSIGDSVKKVTVVAKDKDALKKGLEKAEDVVEDMPEMEDPEAEMEAMAGEMDEPEEEMSEDKDAKIAELEAQLSKMQEMIAKLKA